MHASLWRDSSEGGKHVADTNRTGIDMSTRAWAELLLLSAIWGGIFFSVAIALREIGPVTVVLHRVGWAAALLWLVVVAQGVARGGARGVAVPRGARVWGAFLVMGVLNNVIPFTLMSWGQIQIGTGVTAIFNAMTAVFAVLVAAMFLRDEPLSIRKLGGVMLGVLGVVVIKGFERLGALDPQSLSTYAVLAGALSYAFAGAWARRTLSGQPPEIAAAGMLTGSTLVMAPLALATEGMPTLALSAPTWGAIGYFSVVGTAGAYLLYFRVLAMAGAGNLLLCTLIIPPIAILLGVAFLGEVLEPQTLTGFTLIAAGLAVIDGRLLWWRLTKRQMPR
jgi:drug/metabolite transporter (DMT)-like permease